jgi:hypothetical protein
MGSPYVLFLTIMNSYRFHLRVYSCVFGIKNVIIAPKKACFTTTLQLIPVS